MALQNSQHTYIKAFNCIVEVCGIYKTFFINHFILHHIYTKTDTMFILFFSVKYYVVDMSLKKFIGKKIILWVLYT